MGWGEVRWGWNKKEGEKRRYDEMGIAGLSDRSETTDLN